MGCAGKVEAAPSLPDDGGNLAPSFEGFEFFAKNPQSTDAAFIVTVFIDTTPDAQWQLTKNDVLVADSSGLVLDNVSSHEGAFMAGSQVLLIDMTTMSNAESLFKLTGTVSEIEIQMPENHAGQLDILDIPNGLDVCNVFSFDCELSVPSQIPRSLTRFKFHDCYKFNQPIDSWDVSGLTITANMFRRAIAFNQPLPSWNMANVIDASSMFKFAIAFNQPIGIWNMASLIDAGSMFEGATAFNQDLSLWCVSNLVVAPRDFDAGATAWVLPKPVWGTCPRGEDTLPA